MPPTSTVREAATEPWSSAASLAATPSSSVTASFHSDGRNGFVRRNVVTETASAPCVASTEVLVRVTVQPAGASKR